MALNLKWYLYNAIETVMGYIKNIVYVLLFGLIAMCISQCSSAQKLQKEAPFELGEVYYQNWVAGVKGGGSGINIFISIASNPRKVEFDSIFFQGKAVKAETRNKILVVGRFKSVSNQKEDIIMSIDPYAEYGNKVQMPQKQIPFELKDNECVISYKEEDKIKYFKVDSLAKKKLLAYPNAPHNNE